MMSKKSPDNKASALAFTLILLGIVVASAISLSLVAVEERKGSIGASKSSTAYQVADTGIEKVLQNILRTPPPSGLTRDLTDCKSSGFIEGYIVTDKYSVELKKGNGDRIACNTATQLTDIGRIKATGTAGQNSRAIQVSVNLASPSFKDNFDQLGPTLSSNWTNPTWDDPGNVIINSSTRIADAVSNDAYAYWSANTFNANQFSQAKLLNVNGKDDSGVIVRASATQRTMYRFTWNPIPATPAWFLDKYVNGTLISPPLATTSTGPGQLGDVIKITANGNVITGYVNGVQKLQATDSSIATGFPGVFTGDTDTYLDDWEGGDL